MRVRVPALLLAAGLCLPGVAAQAADGCGDFKWSIARERAAFGSQLPTLRSGDQYTGFLTGVTVVLEPQGGVTYPKPPAHPPKFSPAYGAVLTTPPVAQAGNYQVTLSDEAWIDIVQNGVLVRSSAFSGKTDCPGIRKSVRFPLAAGPVTVEISDAATDHVNLDLLPAEKPIRPRA